MKYSINDEDKINNLKIYIDEKFEILEKEDEELKERIINLENENKELNKRIEILETLQKKYEIFQISENKNKEINKKIEILEKEKNRILERENEKLKLKLKKKNKKINSEENSSESDSNEELSDSFRKLSDKDFNFQNQKALLTYKGHIKEEKIRPFLKKIMIKEKMMILKNLKLFMKIKMKLIIMNILIF